MKTLFIFITLSVVMFIFTACPEQYKYFYLFYNNSQYDVYVHWEHAPTESISDTIIKPQYLIYGPVKKNEYDGISFNRLPDVDSLCIFVLIENENNPDECIVLQRYYLTLDDIVRLSRLHAISYPPSEDMKDIKMYPPYGSK